jgi:hypothetical protein
MIFRSKTEVEMYAQTLAKFAESIQFLGTTLHPCLLVAIFIRVYHHLFIELEVTSKNMFQGLWMDPTYEIRSYSRTNRVAVVRQIPLCVDESLFPKELGLICKKKPKIL